MLLNLVQVANGANWRIGIVRENELLLLCDFASMYDLALAAWHAQSSLEDFATRQSSDETLSYDDAYYGESLWRICVPFHHPLEAARCLVSGTGLTHMASAEARQKMHSAGEETDSIRMYRIGGESGRPPAGAIGGAPEWFYKGNGSILRAHGQSLTVPAYAEDGGEEAEVAGVYLVDLSGRPRRIGFVGGNEFSDHRTEKRNYLYLAHSKLRECSIGPEIAVGGQFNDLPGTVRILRGGEVLWSKEIGSGERRMCHSLANIEHHHFKCAAHRRPGDVHIHFFGADALSIAAGIELREGDVTEVHFQGLGRPLNIPSASRRRRRNRLRCLRPEQG